ncbi:MAG: ABC transporter permease subunit [Opitutae bacterium]|nr:ABC transporter permease subunit [Opitutae bacterium]
MFRFILIRLLQLVPVLLVIITLTFVLVRSVPGGPFSAERKVSEHVLEKLNEHYGLNDPLYIQYFNYLKNICPKKLNPSALADFDLKEGLGIDLGPSFRYEGRTVNELIAESFPVSFELGAYALFLALLIGIPAGTLAALKKNTLLDYIPMSSAMMGICLPSFVLGPLFALVFGLWLDWFPVSGWQSPGGFSWADDLPYKILPAMTLGIFYAAGLARLTRGGMLEVLNQDYIRTARAKGLSSFVVTVKHALRAGLLPVISYFGPVVAGVLSGSFIIEMIFQIPGLGRHFINAANNRDYTLVLGTVLFYATLIILLNLIVDVILVLMNPKLKFDK